MTSPVSISLNLQLHPTSHQLILEIFIKENKKEHHFKIGYKFFSDKVISSRLIKDSILQGDLNSQYQYIYHGLWIYLCENGSLCVISSQCKPYNLEISSIYPVLFFNQFNLETLTIRVGHFENHAQLIARNIFGKSGKIENHHALVVGDSLKLQAHYFENFNLMQRISDDKDTKSVIESSILLSDRFEIVCSGFFKNYQEAKILGLKEGRILAEEGIESSGDISALQQLELVCQKNIVLLKGSYSSPFLRISAGWLIDCRFSVVLLSHRAEIVAPIILNAATIENLPNAWSKYWRWAALGINGLSGISHVASVLKKDSVLAHPAISQTVKAFRILQACKYFYDKRQASLDRTGLLSDLFYLVGYQTLPHFMHSAKLKQTIAVVRILYFLTSARVTTYEKIRYYSTILHYLGKNLENRSMLRVYNLLKQYGVFLWFGRSFLKKNVLNLPEQKKSLQPFIVGLFRSYLPKIFRLKSTSRLKFSEPLIQFILSGGLNHELLNAGMMGVKNSLLAYQRSKHLSPEKFQEINDGVLSFLGVLQKILQFSDDFKGKNWLSLFVQFINMSSVFDQRLSFVANLIANFLDRDLTSCDRLIIKSDFLYNQNQIVTSDLRIHSRRFLNGAMSYLMARDKIRLINEKGRNDGVLQVSDGLLHAKVKYVWKNYGKSLAKDNIFIEGRGQIFCSKESEFCGKEINLSAGNLLHISGKIGAERIQLSGDKEIIIKDDGVLLAVNSISVCAENIMHDGEIMAHHAKVTLDTKNKSIEDKKDSVFLSGKSKVYTEELDIIVDDLVSVSGRVESQKIELQSAKKILIAAGAFLSSTKSITANAQDIIHEGTLDSSEGTLSLCAVRDLIQTESSQTRSGNALLSACHDNVQRGINKCSGKLTETGRIVVQTGLQFADSLEQKTLLELQLLTEAENIVSGTYIIETPNFIQHGRSRAGNIIANVGDVIRVGESASLLSDGSVRVTSSRLYNRGILGSLSKDTLFLVRELIENHGTVFGDTGITLHTPDTLQNNGNILSAEGCVVTHTKLLITGSESMMQGAWGVRNVTKTPVVLKGEQASSKGTIEVTAPHISQEKLVQKAVDIEMSATDIMSTTDTVRFVTRNIVFLGETIVEEASSISQESIKFKASEIDLKKTAKMWAGKQVSIFAKDIRQFGMLESLGNIALEATHDMQLDLTRLQAHDTLYIRQFNGKALDLTTDFTIPMQRLIGGLHIELSLLDEKKSHPLPIQIMVRSPIKMAGKLSFTALGSQFIIAPGVLIESGGLYVRSCAFENYGGIFSQRSVEIDVRQMDGSFNSQGNILNKFKDKTNGPTGLVISQENILLRGNKILNEEGVFWSKKDLILDCQSSVQRSGIVYVGGDTYVESEFPYEMTLAFLEEKDKLEVSGIAPHFICGGNVTLKKGISILGGKFYAAGIVYAPTGKIVIKNVQEFWKGPYCVRDYQAVKAVITRRTQLYYTNTQAKFSWEDPIKVGRFFPASLSSGNKLVLHAEVIENQGVIRSPELRIQTAHLKNHTSLLPYTITEKNRVLPLSSLISENTLFKSMQNIADLPLLDVTAEACPPIGVDSICDYSCYNPMVEIFLIQEGLQQLLRSGYVAGLSSHPEEAWKQLRQNAWNYLQIARKNYFNQTDLQKVDKPILVYQKGTPFLVLPTTTDTLRKEIHSAPTVIYGERGQFLIDTIDNQGRIDFTESLHLSAKQFYMTQPTRLTPNMNRLGTGTLTILVPNTGSLTAHRLIGKVESWHQIGGIIQAGSGGLDLTVSEKAQFEVAEIYKMKRVERYCYAEPMLLPSYILSEGHLTLDVLDGQLIATGVVVKGKKETTLIAKENTILQPKILQYGAVDVGRRNRETFPHRQVAQAPLVGGEDIFVRSREGKVKAVACIFHATHGNIVLQGKQGVEVLPMELSTYLKRHYRKFRGLSYVYGTQIEHHVISIPTRFIASGDLVILGEDLDAHNKLSGCRIIAKNCLVKGGFNEITGATNRSTIIVKQTTVGLTGFLAKKINVIFSKQDHSSFLEESSWISAIRKLHSSQGGATTAISALQVMAHSMEMLSQAKRYRWDAVLKEQCGLGVPSENGLNAKIGFRIGKEHRTIAMTQNVPFVANIEGTFYVDGKRNDLKDAPQIKAKHVVLKQEELCITGSRSTYRNDTESRGLSFSTEARSLGNLTIGIDRGFSNLTESLVKNANISCQTIEIDAKVHVVLDDVNIVANRIFIKTLHLTLRSQKDVRMLSESRLDLSFNMNRYGITPSGTGEKRKILENYIMKPASIRSDELVLLTNSMKLEGAYIVSPIFLSSTLTGVGQISWEIINQMNQRSHAFRMWGGSVSKNQYFGLPVYYAADQNHEISVVLATIVTDNDVPGCTAHRVLDSMIQPLDQRKTSFGWAIPYISSEGLKDLHEWFGSSAKDQSVLIANTDNIDKVFKRRSQEEIENTIFFREKSGELLKTKKAPTKEVLLQNIVFDEVRRLLSLQGRHEKSQVLRDKITRYFSECNTKDKQAALVARLYHHDLGFRMYVNQRIQMALAKQDAYQPMAIAMPLGRAAASLIGLAISWLVTQPGLQRKQEQDQEQGLITLKVEMPPWVPYVLPQFVQLNAMFNPNLQDRRYANFKESLTSGGEVGRRLYRYSSFGQPSSVISWSDLDKIIKAGPPGFSPAPSLKDRYIFVPHPQNIRDWILGSTIGGQASLQFFSVHPEGTVKTSPPGFSLAPPIKNMHIFVPYPSDSRIHRQKDPITLSGEGTGFDSRVRRLIEPGSPWWIADVPRLEPQRVLLYSKSKTDECKQAGDKSYLGKAWKGKDKVFVKDPRKRYEPIVKHDERAHWGEGSVNPIPDFETGQALLDNSLESSDKKERFIVYKGKLIKFRTDNTGGWHPYVVEPDEINPLPQQVSDSILKEMLGKGWISRAKYNKWRKNKE